jgi:hypothetical protein
MLAYGGAVGRAGRAASTLHPAIYSPNIPAYWRTRTSCGARQPSHYPQTAGELPTSCRFCVCRALADCARLVGRGGQVMHQDSSTGYSAWPPSLLPTLYLLSHARQCYAWCDGGEVLTGTCGTPGRLRFVWALLRPTYSRSRLEIAPVLGGRMRIPEYPACSVNTVQHPRLATTSAGPVRLSWTDHAAGLCWHWRGR